jgi:hypothetical protein
MGSIDRPFHNPEGKSWNRHCNASPGCCRDDGGREERQRLENMPTLSEKVDPVLFLLIGGIIFFSLSLFAVDLWFKQDQALFSVLSSLVSGFAGSFFTRLRPKDAPTPASSPDATVDTTATTTVHTEPAKDPAKP